MILLGCFRRLAGLVVLVLVVALAWFFRADVLDAWRSFRGTEPTVLRPSEALAESAQDKLEALAAGESERVALSELEIQSLLQYRYASFFPGFVDSARVSILDDDRLRLTARVPTARFGELPGIGDAGALLPDTADIQVTARLLPMQGGRAALAVDDVTAARIPVPSRLVPVLLGRLGRTPEQGLPPDAMGLRLPPGAGSAYVRRDSLVLMAADTPPPPPPGGR